METSNRQPPTQRTFLQRLLRLVLWLLLAVVLLLGAAATLLVIYEEEVKAVVIAELNKRLRAEVKIQPADIDLTLISTFPDCSLRFKHLLMYEALRVKRRDTLLYAEQLNLHFSLRDLWQKRYRIRSIGLNQAVVKLRVLKSGETNFEFWQSNPAPSENAEPLEFALEQLRVRNSRFSYQHAGNGFSTALAVQHLNLKGRFAERQYTLGTDCRFQLLHCSGQERSYLKNKSCSLRLEMEVNGNDYQMKSADLEFNRLRLELAGGFNLGDSLQHLALQFNAPNLEIGSVLSLLPEGYGKQLQDYKSDGDFYIRGQLGYSPSKSFSVSSDFGVRNGRITYQPNASTATDVQLDGTLRYSKTASALGLKNIHLRLNNDQIAGECLLTDFAEPQLYASLQAGLDLANLQGFLNIDTLRSLKGRLDIRARVEGRIEDLQRQTFSNRVRVDLDATVRELEAGFKNDEQVFAVEYGNIVATGRDLEVSDLQLKRGSSDLRVNGRLPGFFNYLSGTAPLAIQGRLQAGYLRLEDFMVRYHSTGGEGPLIPADIQFALNADIQRLTYANFEAQAIQGELEIRQRKAVVAGMHLQTMGGEAWVDAYADNSSNLLDVALEAKLSNINISELFRQLDNFGQSTLSNRNIKGFASASLQLSGRWNNRLEPDLKSILANCDLKVQRGELLDFKPLQSLSRFVDIHDLQHVKFADLQSTIRIVDQQIYLPKTSLHNSALNLQFSGTHSFDNRIDYHIRLLISDLLAGRRKNRQEEFGPVENDPDNRRSAFIRMTGSVDNPRFEYDRQGFKEKVKEDIRNERQEARQVLREELGLFKKDSLARRPKKEQTHFELEKTGNNPPKKSLEPKRKQEDDDF